MAKALVPTVNHFLSAIATRAHAAATHTHTINRTRSLNYIRIFILTCMMHACAGPMPGSECVARCARVYVFFHNKNVLNPTLNYK